MNNDNANSQSNNTAQIFKGVIFFVMLIVIAIASLFFTFKGLSSARAMEQAQIGREISVGNGYSTKVIRPVALWQMQKAGKENTSIQKFPATYHAPLNPAIYAAVFKVVDGGNADKWRIAKKTNIYQLDRLVAAICVIFLLLSIGVNYLLISKMFDSGIAGVTALLMLFCELMWSFSQSGLPQMLMLFLFSSAMLALWGAVEKKEDNKSAINSILIAGVFMCLLALSHWITIWIYIGFTIFAAFYFKPRGVIATLLIGMLVITVVPIAYLFYLVPTGSIFGTAFYAIHDGLGFSENLIMRSLIPENQDLGLDSLLMKILASTLRQVSDLHRNFGAILIAPVFFLALLHPFRRAELANFRWAILVMWVFAALSMTIYGTPDGAMDSNQVHILFAPIMSAYGLAMISILWNRLEFVHITPAFKNIHFVLIICVSAGPMLLSLPKDLMSGIRNAAIGGSPHLPTYYPIAYNHAIADNTPEDSVIISDTPWAIAWYANRTSIWLPRNLEQITQIEAIAEAQNSPVSAVVISPYSFNSKPIISAGGTNGIYDQLFPLVYGGWAAKGNAPNFLKTHPDFQEFRQKYSYPQPLLYDNYIMYYGKKPLTAGAQ